MPRSPITPRRAAPPSRRGGTSAHAGSPRRALRTLAASLLGMAVLAGAPIATAAIGLAPPASAASSQDWPTYLQNTARTDATTDASLTVAGAPNFGVDWSYQAGGPIATSASIVGSTAYVGAWDGYEYAINTQTGALIWKTSTGVTTDSNCNPATLGITSAAAVVNGVVYVGGGGPYFYALDAGTGAVLWQAYTGDNSVTGAHYNWSSPLIVGNYAYVGIASNCDNPLVQGQLLQIAISGSQQGQIVNTYNFVPNGQVGGGIWTSPTYDAATNTIFLSTGTLAGYTQTQSQAIVALNATTLSYVGSWQLPFGASIADSDWSTTPTLTTDAAGDQLLSVANKNGILYTFNRNNLGAGPVWQHQIAIGGTCPACGDGTIASGIFANGTLYYAGGRNVENGHGAGGSITAFDPGTGNILWTRQTDSPILGSPAYVNGMIGYSEGSTFEVLNAANGQLLYSYMLPASTYGAISVAYGQFFVGTLSGVLYAFGEGTTTTPPTDPNCPAGYTCQDIHSPAKGTESSVGGTLTVTAAGSDIKGTGDQFRYISQQVTGDSQVSAQIVSQAPPSSSVIAQAGLMVRQTNAVQSPFYAILDYPNDSPPDLKVIYRSAWAKNPVTLASVPTSLPVSVMIARTGNSFSAGISTDGVNYQLIPGTTANVDLPTTTMQGVAVASGSSSVTGTATFSNISVGSPPATTMTPPGPADPCPSGWSCADLGNPAPVGDTTASGSTLTLAGTGTGFGGSSDSVHYVYQSVTGNASVSAQVATASGASGKTLDGLMMRASTAPTAPMYSVSLSPGGSAVIRWRVNDGVAYSNTITVASATSPAYLEIVRWQDSNASPPGTYFTTLTSPDGVTWTPVLGSAVAISMGSGSYLAGLAATTGTTGATTTATFTSPTVSAVTSPPASACPSGFTCADIGGPGVPAGNQLVTNGNWTFQASGDIWSVYDEFRYAYQPFPAVSNANGDGTVSVQVGSQAGGGPFMRSGVMIRSGTDPQAPYYGVFATPQHGVVVQWRPSQAAQTSQLVGPASATPVYVEASRYTDTTHGVTYYRAYSSADGVNWTLVPGSTVALSLPGPLVAGVVADANSSTNLTTTTFSNFAQGTPVAPPNVCPSSWTCTDIGGALPTGTDSYSGGTWTETGGGGDIWGTADSFHFAYQQMPADGTVAAHVTAQQNTSAWAKAGVMVRATTDPGSPYYAVFVTPGNGIAVQWRSAQGGSSSQLPATGTVPAYLMVGRYTSGSQVYYTAYTSPDGVNWTAIAGSTQVLSLGSGALLAGIAITSHNQGTAETVTLDTVSVSATELPPPGACPNGWSCADIGTVAPGPGSQTLSGGTWSVTGFGNDIWGTADSFHFACKTISADGSISAQVTSQGNSSAWAKGGLMMRLTTDPGSPYYAVFATPGNGIAVQWRSAQGGSAGQATTAGTVPLYLEITRSGTTYSAYTSPDGVTWTLVPGSTVTLASLSGSLLEGLAVNSHNTGQYSTVTYASLVTSP
jgi:outer membrane protein assembly factor BamB